MKVYLLVCYSLSPPPPYLFLDIDGSEHLHEESLGVLQKLLHLEVGLELMELLHLQRATALSNKTNGRGGYECVTITSSRAATSWVIFLPAEVESS